MTFSTKDKGRLMSFYNRLIETYGAYDPRSLSWIDENSQYVRMRILCEVGEISGHTILDVGSGFGDFYNFLSQRYQDFSYLGIDINPHIVEIATTRYPEGKFLTMEFGEYMGKHVDYVFASGMLSFTVPDYKPFYFAYVKKMFGLSSIATAFNMLNNQYHRSDDIFATYSIPEVYEFCSQLTEKIVIRQDYLRQDFTVYLYH